jgi:YD repeat-containing protein
MRLERVLFISGFLVMASLLSANSQVVSNDLQPGLMPYQSYFGGKIDNISLSSGGLNIQIPLVSYPQRGGRLKMDFELVFNSKPLAYTDVCTVQVPHGPPPTCQWRWIPNSSTIFGPGLSGHPITGWYVADSQGIAQANYIEKVPINNGNSYQNYSWIQVQTADGGIHPSGQIGSSGQITLDGSNYSSVGWGPTTGCSGTCFIQDPNGIMYNNTSWSSIQREDYDGSEISLTSGTYTDTVGRSIPAFPTPTTNFTGQQASVCKGSLPTYELAIWMVPGVNGSTQTYTFCYAQVPWLITNNPNPPSTQSGNIVQLQSVALPNGLSWVFGYDATNGSSVAYGDLTSITFPTGGTVSYTYQSTKSFTSATSYHVSRWVATRADNANDGQGSHQSQYAFTANGGGPRTGASSRSTTVTDPYGNQTVHSFSDALCNGYETLTQYYNGASSGGTLLQSVAKTYNYLSSQSQAYFYPDQTMNVFPASETTTLDNGLSSAKTWSYCCSISIAQEASSGTYGLPSDEKVYDYLATGMGPLLREVQTTYEFQGNSNYLTADLLNLKASVTTLNGSGTQVAQSSYAYDEPQYSGISSGISTQHTSAPFSVRGELTTISVWLNGGTNPQSHTSWFDTGEADQSIDPLGHTTTYGYSSTYAGSLPTQITNAANQGATYTYDFNTGQKTSATDPNQQTVTYSYNDPLGRLTDVLYPNLYLGSSLPHGETKYTYNDSASPVNFVVTKVVTPSMSLQEAVYVDGLGRQWYTQLTSDPQGTVYSEKSYDASGRVYQEWNPTRCVLPGSTSCSGEPTWGITTHLYDALNRPTKEIPPDGSVSANNVSTSYSGNTATVADQVGVSRTSTTDALGRLTQLSENNPGWVTAYVYDPLGNLTCVEQHGGVSSTGCSSPPSSDVSSQWRVRRFTYDSLSRLLTSKNPETGTITYGYNADSFLTSKTDNRGITITYSPDVLHRITAKSYSNSEPTVSYTYDASGTNNYGLGRRTGMTDASGSTTWTYDQMGSISSETRSIGTVQKQISTLHNADESGAQVTYPSGAVVTVAPGGAGRPLAVTDSTNSVNYVKSLLYSPPGQIDSAVYGYSSGFAGITETNSFNSRLQPVLLSAASPSQTEFSLVYGFGLGTGDNGNVY